MSHYFRPKEQMAAACLLLLAAVSIFAWSFLQGRRSGLVNVDTAPALDYRFSINLNEAMWTELALVPGIGKALANRIIKYRETHGDFSDPEDLLRIEGIGPAKLTSLQQYLMPLGSGASRDPSAESGDLR